MPRVATVSAILIMVMFGTGVSLAGAKPNQPYESFRIKTDNIPQATIAGWILPATNGKPKGTIFVCHGYGRSKEYMLSWQFLREKENWNVVMFDFREHGESSHTRHLSSLGYHEIWDLKAVVDHSEQQGLAKPFVICGRSMGASVGLRWAAMDERIVGVLAQSPFRSAYSASRHVATRQTHISWPTSPFALHPWFAAMLKEVDIPKAVSKRDDLRIWLMAGQYDWFPASDQEAILAASPAPRNFKRLLVVPGAGHGDNFWWKGNFALPGTHEYFHQFLEDCRGRRSNLAVWVPGTSITVPIGGASPWSIVGGAGIFMMMLISRRPRRRPVLAPASTRSRPLDRLL